jgi:hypothetical protein
MVLADKPFLYWRFNELTGFGTIAYDETTNANDGTYSATKVTRELDSPCGEGDKSISVTDNGKVTITRKWDGITGPFSYEFWCKPTSINTVIEYSVAVSFARAETNFSIHRAAARVSMDLNIVGSYEVGCNVKSGKWTHFVVVWDDDARVALFEDGRRIIWGAPQAGPLHLGDGVHNFGRWTTGEDFPWEGGLDEFAIYDYALTETQVKSHYLQGNLTSLFRRARKAA